MVFGDDGAIHELGTISGDVTSGMTVALTVPVRASLGRVASQFERDED
jgi:hypothetical protein